MPGNTSIQLNTPAIRKAGQRSRYSINQDNQGKHHDFESCEDTSPTSTSFYASNIFSKVRCNWSSRRQDTAEPSNIPLAVELERWKKNAIGELWDEYESDEFDEEVGLEGAGVNDFLDHGETLQLLSAAGNLFNTKANEIETQNSSTANFPYDQQGIDMLISSLGSLEMWRVEDDQTEQQNPLEIEYQPCDQPTDLKSPEMRINAPYLDDKTPNPVEDSLENLKTHAKFGDDLTSPETSIDLSLSRYTDNEALLPSHTSSANTSYIFAPNSPNQNTSASISDHESDTEVHAGLFRLFNSTSNDEFFEYDRNEASFSQQVTSLEPSNDVISQQNGLDFENKKTLLATKLCNSKTVQEEKQTNSSFLDISDNNPSHKSVPQNDVTDQPQRNKIKLVNYEAGSIEPCLGRGESGKGLQIIRSKELALLKNPKVEDSEEPVSSSSMVSTVCETGCPDRYQKAQNAVSKSKIMNPEFSKNQSIENKKMTKMNEKEEEESSNKLQPAEKKKELQTSSFDKQLAKRIGLSFQQENTETDIVAREYNKIRDNEESNKIQWNDYKSSKPSLKERLFAKSKIPIKRQHNKLLASSMHETLGLQAQNCVVGNGQQKSGRLHSKSFLFLTDKDTKSVTTNNLLSFSVSSAQSFSNLTELSEKISKSNCNSKDIDTSSSPRESNIDSTRLEIFSTVKKHTISSSVSSSVDNLAKEAPSSLFLNSSSQLKPFHEQSESYSDLILPDSSIPYYPNSKKTRQQVDGTNTVSSPQSRSLIPRRSSFDSLNPSSPISTLSFSHQEQSIFGGSLTPHLRPPINYKNSSKDSNTPTKSKASGKSLFPKVYKTKFLNKTNNKSGNFGSTKVDTSEKKDQSPFELHTSQLASQLPKSVQLAAEAGLTRSKTIPTAHDNFNFEPSGRDFDTNNLKTKNVQKNLFESNNDTNNSTPHKSSNSKSTEDPAMYNRPNTPSKSRYTSEDLLYNDKPEKFTTRFTNGSNPKTWPSSALGGRPLSAELIPRRDARNAKKSQEQHRPLSSSSMYFENTLAGDSSPFVDQEKRRVVFNPGNHKTSTNHGSRLFKPTISLHPHDVAEADFPPLENKSSTLSLSSQQRLSRYQPHQSSGPKTRSTSRANDTNAYMFSSSNDEHYQRAYEESPTPPSRKSGNRALKALSYESPLATRPQPAHRRSNSNTSVHSIRPFRTSSQLDHQYTRPRSTISLPAPTSPVVSRLSPKLRTSSIPDNKSYSDEYYEEILNSRPHSRADSVYGSARKSTSSAASIASLAVDMDSQFPKVSDTRSWSNGDNDMLDHDRDLMLDKHSFLPNALANSTKKEMHRRSTPLSVFGNFDGKDEVSDILALNRSNENVASGYVFNDLFQVWAHLRDSDLGAEPGNDYDSDEETENYESKMKKKLRDNMKKSETVKRCLRECIDILNLLPKLKDRVDQLKDRMSEADIVDFEKTLEGAELLKMLQQSKAIQEENEDSEYESDDTTEADDDGSTKRRAKFNKLLDSLAKITSHQVKSVLDNVTIETESNKEKVSGEPSGSKDLEPSPSTKTKQGAGTEKDSITIRRRGTPKSFRKRSSASQTPSFYSLHNSNNHRRQQHTKAQNTNTSEPASLFEHSTKFFSQTSWWTIFIRIVFVVVIMGIVLQGYGYLVATSEITMIPY